MPPGIDQIAKLLYYTQHTLNGDPLRSFGTIEPIELARFIVDQAADKKAEDIVLLDISGQTVLSDYFVLCSANSDRQIKAIVEGIREAVKAEADRHARSVEGEPEHGWVLIDYNDVVVHVFAHATRSYYNLEEFWSEAPVLLKMQ